MSGAFQEITRTPLIEEYPIFNKNFVILRELGYGAFGTVLLCRTRTEDEECAVKCVDIRRQQEVVASREIRHVFELQNKFLVRCDRFWMVESQLHRTLFVQMEYCERGSLREILKSGLIKDLPIVVSYLASNIRDGLEFIHSKGFIHRDIKPENILITKKFEAKIADFGMTTKPSDESHSLTLGPGTQLYVAPEIFSENYTNKVDVFSLGMVFYEFLIALNSTEYDEKLTKVRQFREALVKRLSIEEEKFAQAPLWLKKSIQCMTHLNPEKRQPFWKVVDKFCSDLPIHVAILEQLDGNFKNMNEESPSTAVDIFGSHLDSAKQRDAFWSAFLKCSINFVVSNELVSSGMCALLEWINEQRTRRDADVEDIWEWRLWLHYRKTSTVMHAYDQLRLARQTFDALPLPHPLRIRTLLHIIQQIHFLEAQHAQLKYLLGHIISPHAKQLYYGLWVNSRNEKSNVEAALGRCQEQIKKGCKVDNVVSEQPRCPLQNKKSIQFTNNFNDLVNPKQLQKEFVKPTKNISSFRFDAYSKAKTALKQRTKEWGSGGLRSPSGGGSRRPELLLQTRQNICRLQRKSQTLDFTAIAGNRLHLPISPCLSHFLNLKWMKNCWRESNP